jgi:hypothetical protein
MENKGLNWKKIGLVCLGWDSSSRVIIELEIKWIKIGA